MAYVRNLLRNQNQSHCTFDKFWFGVRRLSLPIHLLQALNSKKYACPYSKVHSIPSFFPNFAVRGHFFEENYSDLRQNAKFLDTGQILNTCIFRQA